jgi:hypothetical protein
MLLCVGCSIQMVRLDLLLLGLLLRVAHGRCSLVEVACADLRRGHRRLDRKLWLGGVDGCVGRGASRSNELDLAGDQPLLLPIGG